MSKVNVEVVGIRNESAGGGCCCAGGCGSGGCGPAPTMGEQYQKLADFLAGSELKDQVHLTFIDVLTDELENHPAINQALEEELDLPITLINGLVRFFGGLSTQDVYEAIKEE